MAEAPTRWLIVKIGSAGDVHVDLKPSSLELMKEAVTKLNQDGGLVVYYAESVYQAASEASMATFKQLLELKPRILMGTNASSEWGRLDWVEVQRNPVVSRVFFARGASFLISPDPRPDQPKPSVMVGALKEKNEDQFFNALSLVIRAARVVETPQQAPEMAMNDNAAAIPSLHVRLGYETRRWASAYLADEIPTNIASFERDLWWLANQTFGSWPLPSGRKLSGQEVLDLFDGPKPA